MRLILEEGTEVLIPLLVVFTELFLYFGWNGQAVPTLVALSAEDFARSTILKLVSALIQIMTCGFAAFCVNNLCVHVTSALSKYTSQASVRIVPLASWGVCRPCLSTD